MIQVEDRDGVTILGMADGKANAMSLEFCQQLTESFLNWTIPAPVPLSSPAVAEFFPLGSTSCVCSMAALHTSGSSFRR